MNSTYFTLSQAAKETGKSKSVISKSLSNGTLSYVEKNDSGYKIDPAELFRVYPKKNERTLSERKQRTAKNPNENSMLQRENEILLERLREKDELIDDLKTDRNHWRHQATNLLTDQSNKANISLIQSVKNFLAPKHPKEI